VTAAGRGRAWDDRAVSLLPFGLARVDGASMVPAYYEGDLLLVRYGPAAVSRLRAGSVVLARDPRQPELIIVKRAARREGAAGWWLLADNEFALGDSRQFGAVAPELILGRVVGRLRRGRR
jgi:nickel-type superoxide dismutase maturation protease